MSASPSVLLVNPRATYAHEIAQKCYPPLNLLYLARALLDDGVRVRVLDANALGLSDEAIAARAAEMSPGLLGLPLYTEILAPVYRLVNRLRGAVPSARCVLGGAHASAMPAETLADFPAVDFVLRGYAERGMVELCRALAGRAGLDAVNGLAYRADGAVRENAFTPAGADADDVGFPARELVEEVYCRKRYYTLLVRARPVDTLVTSRGCPYACHFCYNQDHRYRSRSPDHVMEEICDIARRGIRDIEIVDDTFTLERERAMAVFGRLIAERLPVTFRIKSRVDAVDRELLATAKRAGVYMISYGAESGDDDMLRRMNKQTTAADNARAIRLTKAAGIACHTAWIIGYPGETPESVARTIDLIVKTRPTTAQIALLRPYPRTVAYDEARKGGMLRGEWGVESEAYPWVQLPWVRDRAHLEGIVQKAIRKVYYRPYYVWQFGRMVLAGANVTLARYAVQELRKNLVNLIRPGKRRGGSV